MPNSLAIINIPTLPVKFNFNKAAIFRAFKSSIIKNDLFLVRL
jgi:hypothetical protein